MPIFCRTSHLVVAQLLFLLPLCAPASAREASSASPASPQVVLVKGGCFRMGDEFGAGGLDEKPVHEACVSDFYLGKYPVTQKEWQEVMGTNPSRHAGGGSLPVENVSWKDAQAFIEALRKKTGKEWRLPTEAEWEYAARSGGKKEKYPGTGSDEKLGDYAWMESNSGFVTHPVGAKRPNGLGLYDMAGNVWQWVQDRYDRDYYRQSPRSNPKGDPFGVNRIIRGGSAYKEAGFLRSSYRDYQAPETRGDVIGLRLALPAE